MKKKAEEARRERMKRQAPKRSESHAPSSSVALADAHALMTKRESVKYALGDWFIDSGATDHMSYEQSDFFSLKRLSPSIRVVLGDDTAVYAYGMGSIYLNSEVLLTRVLFMPDLGTRLLSVSAVTQLGCQVILIGLAALSGKIMSTFSPLPPRVTCLRLTYIMRISARQLQTIVVT